VLVGLGFAAFHAPASACAVVIPEDYEGSAKQLSDVRAALAASTAIIDGQVIRPFVQGRQNALVLAYHVLKGPKQSLFEIGVGDSCSIALDHVGERARMILHDGPDVYTLSGDQSGARIQDRILGSDRRKIWPFYAGRADGSK
jgi:hypothetical protein